MASFHAKDIVLKHIVQAFAHDSLRWMGIEHTDVIGVLPTELPTVEIRSDMMDYVFIMSDDTLLHLEFQSTAEKTLHRFLLYDTLLSQQTGRSVRTVVLYANQVTQAVGTLDIGTAVYHVENIYLAHKDGEAVLARVVEHIEQDRFTFEDRFDLAFALHMRRSRDLQDMIHQSIALIEQIPSKQEQSYVAALFAELSTRWLQDDAASQIRKMVTRMDLLREIIEEAQEQGIKKGIQQGLQKGLQQGHENMLIRNVRSMKQKGESEARIASYAGQTQGRIGPRR